MSDKAKTVVIVTLSLGCVALIGLVVYQRLVIDAQMKLLVEMYQFIQAGCPFSQLN